jgi:hypothetical protein
MSSLLQGKDIPNIDDFKYTSAKYSVEFQFYLNLNYGERIITHVPNFGENEKMENSHEECD